MGIVETLLLFLAVLVVAGLASFLAGYLERSTSKQVYHWERSIQLLLMMSALLSLILVVPFGFWGGVPALVLFSIPLLMDVYFIQTRPNWWDVEEENIELAD